MTEVDDEIDAVKAVYLDDVVSEGSGKDGSRWLKVRYGDPLKPACPFIQVRDLSTHKTNQIGSTQTPRERKR